MPASSEKWTNALCSGFLYHSVLLLHGVIYKSTTNKKPILYINKNSFIVIILVWFDYHVGWYSFWIHKQWFYKYRWQRSALRFLYFSYKKNPEFHYLWRVRVDLFTLFLQCIRKEKVLICQRVVEVLFNEITGDYETHRVWEAQLEQHLLESNVKRITQN